ncbi:MAG: D-alanyl-D-alanine carboxypeptidase [Thermoleophilaceae bacterium]|jgi:hypothetical protein|nr:D-alanyl-D-alanine carboxypeptidase [Thermoleophilaceae bacterium]
MSIESALARISELNTAFVPPAAAPATTAPAATDGTFASTLQSAMGTPAAAGAQPSFTPAAPGAFPHLSGDLDCNPELLRRLEALAAQRGETWHINSGLRTLAEQQQLWDNRGSNPFPVAQPGHSRHESGNAADVSIGGRPIQTVIGAAELRAAGLAPLAGDAVHVELPS